MFLWGGETNVVGKIWSTRGAKRSCISHTLRGGDSPRKISNARRGTHPSYKRKVNSCCRRSGCCLVVHDANLFGNYLW